MRAATYRRPRREAAGAGGVGGGGAVGAAGDGPEHPACSIGGRKVNENGKAATPRNLLGGVDARLFMLCVGLCPSASEQYAGRSAGDKRRGGGKPDRRL